MCWPITHVLVCLNTTYIFVVCHNDVFRIGIICLSISSFPWHSCHAKQAIICYHIHRLFSSHINRYFLSEIYKTRHLVFWPNPNIGVHLHYPLPLDFNMNWKLWKATRYIIIIHTHQSTFCNQVRLLSFLQWSPTVPRYFETSDAERQSQDLTIHRRSLDNPNTPNLTTIHKAEKFWKLLSRYKLVLLCVVKYFDQGQTP